jgi:hypothetical protein
MKDQEAKILKLLQSHFNEWVPVYELARIALQYNARVKSLRAKGYKIENDILEVIDGEKHTGFKLISEPAELHQETAENHEAVRHNHEIQERQAFEDSKGQMAFCK